MIHRKSFTLIEILVVIAVLAGLIAFLVPNYMEIRIKARDTKRKGDLKTIQKALELYSQNQNPQAYPTTLPAPCQKLTDSMSIVYLPQVPQDPLSLCTGSVGSYYYIQPTAAPGVIDPNKYYMYACAENKNDPDVVTCPADFDAITNSVCATPKCYQLTEP